MQANEYVKEYGWDGAKRVIGLTVGNSWADHYNIEDDSIGTAGTIYSKKLCEHNDNFVCLRSLKRLVESLELVESYGGLKESIRFSKQPYRQVSTPDTHKKLCNAIADVESCNA